MCNTWCSSSGVERRVVEVVEGICKGGMQPAVRVMRFRRAGGCELEPEPELELSSVNVTEGELSSLNVTEGERFTPDSLRLTASLFSGTSLILGTSAQPACQPRQAENTGEQTVKACVRQYTPLHCAPLHFDSVVSPRLARAKPGQKRGKRKIKTQ